MSRLSPEQLHYAKTHEWVHVAAEPSGAKIATVGITGFALEALTDLTHIELPKVSKAVKAGQPFGEIESVKAVSDLYSPVDGEVLEVHSDLADRLESLPSDPYGDGWMVKIKVTDETALKKLMDYAAYQKQCAEEGH